MNLAYRLMSKDLHWHARVLYRVMQPTWTWYCQQVTHIKSPKHALANSCTLADGNWAKENHLWETLRTCMYDRKAGEYMALTDDTCNRAVQLALHIVSHRAWSMARHSVPPEDYANVLRPGPGAATVAQRMASEWKTLTLLEVVRHKQTPSHRELFSDLTFAQNNAVRLMYAFFERDGWLAQSNDGRHILLGMLQAFADNKIIEDVHSVLRNAG